MEKLLRSGERQVAETLEDIEEWHLWRYREAAKQVEGKRVLDLGSGCGYGSYILAEEGKAKAVVAIDDCKEAIEFAKNNYKTATIEYKAGDIMKMRGKYDVVAAFEIVEHIEDFEGIWNKLSTLVKDGGTLFLSVPHTSIPVSVSKWHFRHYQRGEVKKFLEQRGFIVDTLDTPRFQNGLAVFCVASKPKKRKKK